MYFNSDSIKLTQKKQDFIPRIANIQFEVVPTSMQYTTTLVTPVGHKQIVLNKKPFCRKA